MRKEQKLGYILSEADRKLINIANRLALFTQEQSKNVVKIMSSQDKIVRFIKSIEKNDR